jgi:outer membrane protein assembly factor BamE
LKFWESDAPPAKEPEQAKEVAKAQSAQVAKQIEPVKAAEAEAPKAVEPAAVSEPAPLVEQAAAPAETAAEVKAAAQDVAKEVASEVVSPEPATVAETKQVPESYDASVAKMVDAWANAWRTKNVNAYLNFYADSFKPEGMSKKAWVEQRKQRVGGKSAAISLVLDNISIKADAKKANVTFVQQYSSGNFSDKVAKALSLERANGQWLIVRESVASASTQPSSQPVVDGAEYVKPRDVTADEKSEAMPEKMLQESAKQAQRAQPQQVQPQKPQPEAKAVEAKPVDAKAAPIKPESAPVKAEVAKPAAPVDKKDLPLPPEDSSGYFERLLEKIGF